MSKLKLKGVISFYTAGWLNVKMPCEIELQLETNSSEHRPDDSSVDYSKQYLTFIAKSDGTFKFSGSSNTNTIQCSTDNGETWSDAAQVVEISVNNGDKVLWKGEMTPTSVTPPSSWGGIGYFSASTATFDIKGNIMSLLFGDNYAEQTNLSGKDYAFCRLFKDTKCVNADNCILPATTLATRCYMSMFDSCTSLTTVPSLPATTLLEYCYGGMFYGCTNLNYIKMLATNISAPSCLNNWVLGVAANGVFVKNDLATWNATGDSGVPTGWTVVTESESEVVAKNYQITQLEARVAALEQTLGG